MLQILRLPYNVIRTVYEKTSIHRAVIEELDSPELREAYKVCRGITRKHAKTFYLATRFLPNIKQRSIFAIYALCRFVDDLIDEAEDLIAQKELTLGEIESMIETWKSKLVDTYDGKQFDNPILIALSDVLKSYKIPIELPLELIDGVSMDLTKNRYRNFDELYGYSYKVASVVGLMTSQVFGYSDRRALGHAVSLGIAMQLTNILRDVGEDLQRGRIYLPQDEMMRFGVSEHDLFNHVVDSNFIGFMEFQIERAEEYYRDADKGIKMLSPDSRYAVAMARYNYSRILEKIRKNNYQVFTNRAYVSTAQKLFVIPKVLLGK